MRRGVPFVLGDLPAALVAQPLEPVLSEEPHHHVARQRRHQRGKLDGMAQYLLVEARRVLVVERRVSARRARAHAAHIISVAISALSVAASISGMLGLPAPITSSASPLVCYSRRGCLARLRATAANRSSPSRKGRARAEAVSGARSPGGSRSCYNRETPG